MPEKSIIEQIKHYQRDIVKCPEDTKRMIRCIERLTVLPVTIAHLQETGVGRSVNELRKCGGEVGAAANSLVCKWKSMVKDDDSDEEESEVEDSLEHSKSLSSDNKNVHSYQRTEALQKHKQADSSNHHKISISSQNSSSKTKAHHHGTNSSKHSSSRSSRPDEKTHRDSSSKSGNSSSKGVNHSHSSSSSSKTEHASRSHKTHDSETECNGNTKTNTISKYNTSNTNNVKHSSHSALSDSKSKNSKHNYDKDKYRRKEDTSSTQNSSKKYNLKAVDSDSSDDEVYKPTSKKQKKLDSDEEQEYQSKSSSKVIDSKRESFNDSDSKSESEEERESNEEKSDIESADDSDSDNRNYSTYNTSENELADSDHKISVARDSEENESEGNASDKDSDENNTETSNDSSEEEEKYIPVKIKREKESPVRQLKPHNNEKYQPSHTKSKCISNSQRKNNVKEEQDECIKKEKIDRKSKSSDTIQKKTEKDRSDRKHNMDSKSRSSHSENVCKENKLDKKVKIKIEKEEDGSIDCVSGASFADALLGLSDTKKKIKKKATASSQDKSHRDIDKTSRAHRDGDKSSGNKMKSLSKTDVRSLPSTSSSRDPFKEPNLLSKNVKLEPLSVDLKATLPEISPDYKPLPHFSPPDSPPSKKAKFMSQEDALANIMSTKNQRTKVYSGNKTGYTKVPSLFDLCIQVLQNNIEGLEYTGGVPYDLLKPVLDRATAEQLHQLEYYNPYLVEDTDGLWQFHCKKEFRGKEPDEFETWRELYLRLLDERERKLKALKENISQSMAKSTPIRQTKLAYIDSVVKPPRNVARQQMKMGTGKAAKHDLVSKAMVGAAGSSPAPESVSVPAPPRSNSSHSPFPIPNFLKKKKAPLMAKALQLIKGNRFKR